MPRRVPSDAGESEARLQVERFVSELLETASQVAVRAGADHASAEHVRSAAYHLYAQGRSRANQALVALGSLVTGGSVSALVALLLADSPPPLALGGSALGLLVGGVLAAAGMFRS